MGCHCKCEFDSRALSLASISKATPAFHRPHAHNWWWAPQRHRGTMHCSSCSLHRAKCTICREQLAEPWFDRCCWDGHVAHSDHKRTSRAPWNIAHSRQLAWYHDTCCHQSLPQSSRIRERFCTRISAHECLRRMWRCRDSSRHVWSWWEGWKKWENDERNIFYIKSFNIVQTPQKPPRDIHNSAAVSKSM